MKHSLITVLAEILSEASSTNKVLYSSLHFYFTRVKFWHSNYFNETHLNPHNCTWSIDPPLVNIQDKVLKKKEG